MSNHSKPRTCSSGETRAKRTQSPSVTANHQAPTSPDTSLPWSQDYAHGGWSGRMFYHQLRAISTPHWSPSDTEHALSCLTVDPLPLNRAREITLSQVLDTPEELSDRLFLSPAMVRRFVLSSVRRCRTISRVLLRGRTGLTFLKISCSRRARGFVFSAQPSTNVSKASRKGGPLDFLSTAAEFF